MITVTRRIFTLTATAALLARPSQWLPDDVLVQAKEVLPNQWCMVHCLDHLDRRIEDMNEMAHLQWVGAEYQVVNELTFWAPHSCVVSGFAVEPIIQRGDMNTCHMFTGDQLDLRIMLDASPSRPS